MYSASVGMSGSLCEGIGIDWNRSRIKLFVCLFDRVCDSYFGAYAAIHRIKSEFCTGGKQLREFHMEFTGDVCSISGSRFQSRVS